MKKIIAFFDIDPCSKDDIFPVELEVENVQFTEHGVWFDENNHRVFVPFKNILYVKVEK